MLHVDDLVINLALDERQRENDSEGRAYVVMSHYNPHIDSLAINLALDKRHSDVSEARHIWL